MRVKPFTFTKTKRVKTEHKGISIDLTVKEAADLAAYLSVAATPDCRYNDLYDALSCFARENGVSSDLTPSLGTTIWCFKMKMVAE